MRLSITAHTSLPWRFHESTADLRRRTSLRRAIGSLALMRQFKRDSRGERDTWARRHNLTLPPGQRRTDGFPRFGTHLHRPAPAVPTHPVIEISGPSGESFAVPLATLATLPRRDLTADFHCVAGWSAINLQWEGVAFESFYRAIIEPSVQLGSSITHVAFGGLDGYRSVTTDRGRPRRRVCGRRSVIAISRLGRYGPIYRLLISPIAFLSARGSRRNPATRASP